MLIVKVDVLQTEPLEQDLLMLGRLADAPRADDLSGSHR
jgi:hypothetical protein